MKKSVTGLRAWLVQRISAVWMLLFIVFVLFHFLFDPPHSYLAWQGWIMSPGVSVATFVFLAALSMHAWVGIRDVVMDYVRPVALRIATLTLLGFGLLAISAWVGRILLTGRG
ncbi:MAG: succinate dehydrogenase, hydrophobic membrane anchor protein [Burkholderiaceae bacterium]|nr:succinate dehydrogenase, hydrophobic membrane anchor protein [Burkholderiaceae bacterium]